MPSPSSTRGGSKGLALEGLAISTGQHWPQHKDMCAFLKGKEKKKSFLTLYIRDRGAKMFCSKM